MRTTCRPSGSPPSANDPVESLTSNTRLPRTATITPEMGRPLMDERTVPVSRAVVSRWACAGVTSMPRSSKPPSGARRIRPRFFPNVRMRYDGTAAARGAPGDLLVLHSIAALRRWRRRSTVRVGQRNLLLHHVAAEPDHAVAAHDRVHRIRLPRERVRVRARHPGPREVVPAALAIGMTVDHPHSARPSRVLAGLLRHDARRGGMPGLHVRGRDPSHDHGVAMDLPDHAAHEFGREGAVLEREVATRLVGEEEGAGVRAG